MLIMGPSTTLRKEVLPDSGGDVKKMRSGISEMTGARDQVKGFETRERNTQPEGKRWSAISPVSASGGGGQPAALL